MKTIKLTTHELGVFLSTIKGNPIATVTMLSDQKSKLSAFAKKTLTDSVFKLTEMQVQLGSTYKTRVNNQLEREGKQADFEPQYGNVRRVKGCFGLGANDWNADRKYLICTPNKNNKPKVAYIYQGKKVDQKFIESVFIPSALKKYKNKSQGTDKQIFHMTPMLKSILEINVNGQRIVHIR